VLKIDSYTLKTCINLIDLIEITHLKSFLKENFVEITLLAYMVVWLLLWYRP
jgi:hypothetical protein